MPRRKGLYDNVASRLTEGTVASSLKQKESVGKGTVRFKSPCISSINDNAKKRQTAPVSEFAMPSNPV